MFMAIKTNVKWKGNIITPEHISSLFFIKCVGTPVVKFNLISYVVSNHGLLMAKELSKKCIV